MKLNLIAVAVLCCWTSAVCRGEEARLVILPEGTNQIKPIGANIVLTCKAEVEDPSQVTDLRWIGPDGQDLTLSERISSEDLGGEFGRSLFIKGLQDEDSGNYSCVAVYANNQRLSAFVKLSTIVGITWEDAVPQQSAIFGQAYKLRCTVKANPPARIDWMKNSQMISNSAHYTVESDGLLIREVSSEDEGTFTCRARVPQTGQLEERKINLDVLIAPEFSREPKDVDVVEGETAVLECHATGKPNPTHTWVDANGQNLTGRERFTVDDDSGHLTISDVHRNDAGVYSCVAENSAGRSSVNATVRVILRPQIVEFQNISGVVSREASLMCKASGDPLPELVFYKEGSNVPYVAGAQPQDERIIVDTGREGELAQAKLIIKDLMRSDDGLYECVARNQGGNVTKMGHLTIEFPPSFSSTPMREAWSWNQHSVNLTCRAESIPNASIAWFFENRPVENGDNYVIHAANGESTLTVSPLDETYYGNYTCQASNVHGKAEHQIELKEARTPGALLQVTFATVTATTITFNFIGPADNGGLPIEAFAVEYKGVGEEWAEKPLQRIWPTDSSYILDGLEPQASYIFRFAAKNKAGFGPWENEQTFTMPKRAEPEEPTIIAKPENSIVSTPYSDKYELIWSAPLDNGEPIDYFDVTYYIVRNMSNDWKQEGQFIQSRVPNQGELKYELKNLKPDTFYRIELRAHNSIGNSPPAQIILRTAKDASHLDGPAAPASQSQNTPVIVGVIIAVLILVAVIVDVTCFFVNQTGLTSIICGKVNKKKHSGATKDALVEAGKDDQGEKTPLKESNEKEEQRNLEENSNKQPENQSSPVYKNEDNKQLIKEENGSGKKSASKSSIAKDSAV